MANDRQKELTAYQNMYATPSPVSTGFATNNGRVNYSVAGVAGPADFFGPMQPLLPIAQDNAYARQWDYPVGFNTRIVPRQEENITFDQLKRMADSFDIVRAIIEKRKEYIVGQKWIIAPKDQKQAKDSRCDEMQAFFSSPDKLHTWREWLRMLLEQLYVIDAVSIASIQARNGKPYALELIDGATVRRVLDEGGRTPPPPNPAYQQILKGMPAVDYTTDQLIYKPRNLRIHKVYGYSPIEQIVMTVNIALHRQLYQLNYYTEGSTPDLIFQVPETWQPNQIAQFREYWLSMLQGNLGNRRGAMFVPKGVAPYNTKDMVLKDAYDEWLTRICCFAFSISPTPFIKETNHATADNQKEAAMQEGLGSDLGYITDLIEFIMATKFGYSDLTLHWVEEDSVDPFIRAQTYQIYLMNKVYTPNEVRQKLGEEPLTPAQIEELTPPQPEPDNFGAEGGDSTKLGKLKSVPRSPRSTKKGPLY